MARTRRLDSGARSPENYMGVVHRVCCCPWLVACCAFGQDSAAAFALLVEREESGRLRRADSGSALIGLQDAAVQRAARRRAAELQLLGC